VDIELTPGLRAQRGHADCLVIATRTNKDGAVQSTHPRVGILVPLILAAFLAMTARAEAGPIVSSAAGCDAQVLEQPFLRYADPGQYFLAPDGSFSGGAQGWRLSDADVVAENQPHSTHASEGVASLRVPVGTSVTSPAVCVGLAHPTLRFFAHGDGSLLDTLAVEVLFEDAGGSVHALPIGVVLGGAQWRPTLPMPIVANLLALLPGERTAVAFRFTAHGASGAWTIDDVYVDPYSKG
jgi:hypothetical protein